MSDDIGVDQSVDTGAEVTAPAEESGQGITEAPPERTYLPDDYATHHVKVKVDGEEQDVPLSEALGGYQRQADYTRKTQELARQQESAQFAITLQRALENNPSATLRILQEQYGDHRSCSSRRTTRTNGWTRTRPAGEQYDERLSHWEDFQAEQELQQALRVLHHGTARTSIPEPSSPEPPRWDAWTWRTSTKRWRSRRCGRSNVLNKQATQQREAEDDSRNEAKAGLTMHGGSGPGATVPSRSSPVTPPPSRGLPRGQATARPRLTFGVVLDLGAPHACGQRQLRLPPGDHPRQLPQDPHRQHLQVPSAAVVAHGEEPSAQALGRREDRRAPHLRRRPGRFVRRMGRHQHRPPRRHLGRRVSRGVNCSAPSPSPGSKRPRTTAKRKSSTSSKPRSCRPKRR